MNEQIISAWLNVLRELEVSLTVEVTEGVTSQHHQLTDMECLAVSIPTAIKLLESL